MSEDDKCTNKDVESLMSNAYFGELDEVKRKIDLGLNINSICETFGNSSLLLAITAENEEMVGFLLENGASPDLPNSKTGETPLMRAVERNNEPITRLLLRAGCNLFAVSYAGKTAFDLASPDRQAQLRRAVLRRQKEQQEKTAKNKVVSAFYYVGALAKFFLATCRKVQQIKQPVTPRQSVSENTREG